MDASKDYYEILGVHSSAELRVIRAAYKAMAQYYHPDKAENKEEANRKMADINEAYEILSNTEKRREYDAKRGTNARAEDSVFSDTYDAPNGHSQSKEWTDVVHIYPELTIYLQSLRKINWALGDKYCTRLLHTKEYKHGERIAGEMSNEFLRRYFGSDFGILAFAEDLIYLGHKRATKMLNEQIQVFGPNPDRRAVEGIISRIKEDYDIPEIWTVNKEKGKREAEKQRKTEEQEKYVKPTGQWNSGKSDSGKSSPDIVPLIMLGATLMILVLGIVILV